MAARRLALPFDLTGAIDAEDQRPGTRAPLLSRGRGIEGQALGPAGRLHPALGGIEGPLPGLVEVLDPPGNGQRRPRVRGRSETASGLSKLLAAAMESALIVSTVA